MGWGRGMMGGGNKGGSRATPQAWRIFGQVTVLATVPAFAMNRAIFHHFGAPTDVTFNRLAYIPEHHLNITNIKVTGDCFVPNHPHNTCASGIIRHTWIMLVTYV